MRPERPVPIEMKVIDFDPRDRLAMECPSCHCRVGRQGYDLQLELPPDYLVIRYVTRHWCRRCSGNGVRIRPTGWIEPYPRSGAEGGNLTQWAR